MASSSTLEERLHQALRAAGDSSPPGSALAARARARAGARRRHRTLAAAVALAAVCVPVTAALSAGPDDEAPPSPATDPSPQRPTPRGPSVPAGYHVERFRGVSVHVPNTWTGGALADWCRRGDTPGNPVVERPVDRSSAADCGSPELGYGLQFIDTAALRVRMPAETLHRYRPGIGRAAFPRGSWIGLTCGHCDVAVRVVAPDEYVVRYVLSTVVNSKG